MENIRIFENAEFGKVRTVDVDGVIHFVGKDVADILGYQNGSRDINRHVDEEDRQKTMIFDGNQNKETIIITESGLYSLVLSSKLPTAKKFKHWVTSEILPTIRKTGGYVNNDDMFINTYLPFADETTKMLFKNTLNVINNQNKLISEQKNEIVRKSNVIQGFADDTPNPTKRKILNEVVRYGGNYQERWNVLYKEFKATYGIDISRRFKNYGEKDERPKMKNKLDFVEKKLNMLNELYGIAVKLYENDIEKIKERYDIVSKKGN